MNRNSIRDFYNTEASRYVNERYSEETAEGRIALTRRNIVLELCGDGAQRWALDVGCGPAILSQELAARRFVIINMDIAESMLTCGRSTVSDPQNGYIGWVNGDVHTPPFKPESFDLVVAIGVLGLADHPRELLPTLARILKPQGSLIIQFANLSSPTAYINRYLQALLDRLRLPMGPLFETRLRASAISPARYSYSTMRRLLEQSSFQVRRRIFYDFRPPLFHILPESVKRPTVELLQNLSHFPKLDHLGEGCVIDAVKTSRTVTQCSEG